MNAQQSAKLTVSKASFSMVNLDALLAKMEKLLISTVNVQLPLILWQQQQEIGEIASEQILLIPTQDTLDNALNAETAMLWIRTTIAESVVQKVA